MFGPSKAIADAPPDPKTAFMKEVEAILRSMPSVRLIKPDPGRSAFEVHMGDKEHTFFLENIFVEMRELSPEERAHRIRAIASTFAAEDSSAIPWEEVQPRLVPLLRASTIFTSVVADPTKRPIVRPFAPFLIETVGVDYDVRRRSPPCPRHPRLRRRDLR